MFSASSEGKKLMYGKSLLIWLQVRNLSGEWIYAKPVPGTFVCNIGDMLKVSFCAKLAEILSILATLFILFL
jgi:hypothetical protein